MMTDPPPQPTPPTHHNPQPHPPQLFKLFQRSNGVGGHGTRPGAECAVVFDRAVVKRETPLDIMNPPYRVVAFSRNRNITELSPSIKKGLRASTCLFLLNKFAVPALSSTFPRVRGFEWLGLGGYHACILLCLFPPA